MAPIPVEPTPAPESVTAPPSGAAAQAAAGSPAARSKPVNKDDFKNDPLIQKALEIFKAQIVEVRA
jgi:hypothetical protein